MEAEIVLPHGREDLEIPLRKTLVIDKELRDKVKKSTLEMFDEIETRK